MVKQQNYSKKISSEAIKQKCMQTISDHDIPTIWRIAEGSENSGSLQCSPGAFLWGHYQGSTLCLYWHPKYAREKECIYSTALVPEACMHKFRWGGLSCKSLSFNSRNCAVNHAAKKSYMQPNFTRFGSKCLKWTSVTKLTKHNRYVYVVKEGNRRAVTHLTFPYFLDARPQRDYKELCKK